MYSLHFFFYLCLAFLVFFFSLFVSCLRVFFFFFFFLTLIAKQGAFTCETPKKKINRISTDTHLHHGVALLGWGEFFLLWEH